MIGIYKITNLINGKCYIGQTTNYSRRMKEHQRRYLILNEKILNTLLYRAFNKYGIKNFNFELIEECKKQDLNEREKFWVEYFNCYAPLGYNVALAGCTYASKQQYETSIQIKNEIKNNLLFSLSEIGEKYNMTLQNISDINRGITWTDENETYPLRSRQTIKNKKPYNKNKKELPITKENLKYKIRNQSFVSIGKEFGVSDNAIRKWCVKYSLPKTKKEINSYSDEEWVKI